MAVLGIMKYRNIVGTIELSKQNHCLRGEMIGVRGLVRYEGHTLEELETDFHSRADYYLSQNISQD